ncbi:LPS export ABC transporter permease LptG [Aquincola sp. J276]|uniref:LPS export ABC transporter permease LptG n=1 Tax=Aquincola sp. J276 TaxID=2898432 RepID=UPI0021511002|nr:LPS export ABC transporter permease LptG [Aquincola sp. J276]MCR5867516.1 LPS export ABC transporter permease LptG [Aquincola sp. J276]
MKTVRRLLYRDISSAVVFVALAFLSLFFFIDFVDALDKVGRPGFTIGSALLSGLLDMPGHFYELFPIAVLIGAIYAMSRLAQSSEFTILRTGGLGPGRALALLAGLGAAFAIVTFVIGDYVAPASERQAVAVQSRTQGGRELGRAGAWLKDRRSTPEGERNISVNVQRTTADGRLQGIRIFEFDRDGRLLTRVGAESGRVTDGGHWQLAQATVTHWPTDVAGARLVDEKHAQLEWPTSLTGDVVAAAVLPVSTMSTIELWRYSMHLTDQEQAAQRHAILFWKKALYPFACLVMMGLALPFAYLHARSGGVSLKVFGGILLGISFVLLNNVASHLGLLRNWTPWVVAATPSLLYLLMSLAAFTWLVRYR